MMRGLLLALLLALAPLAAQAGGATDLLRSTGITAITPIYTGPTLGTSNVWDTNATGNRTTTLAAAPGVGDLLIGYCGNSWSSGTTAAPTAVGSFTRFVATLGGGGLPSSNIGSFSWFYLYITTPGVTSYTLCNALTVGGAALWDIPASGVTGTWASDFIAYTDGSDRTGLTATWSISSTGYSQIALALANTNCSSSPITGSALTGDITQGAANDEGSDPSGQAVYAAWAGVAGPKVLSSTFTAGTNCGLSSMTIAGSVVIK